MKKPTNREASMKDIREDTKLAGKAGMSPRKFEGTKADAKHDAGMKRGGMARKGGRGC